MKTEFHDPSSADDDDDLDKYFDTRVVKQKETQASLFISVVKYRAIAQLTGIAGRMELDQDGLTELIDDLTEARDFIDRHPARKKE